MCGLYGFINYGNKINNSELSIICNSLARESEVRGDHATGISYINKGRLIIDKAPKPAHKINFRLPKTIALKGHTRHATQGSEKRNVNNHPFQGFTKYHKPFSLAHNGVLFNDRSLRNENNLPKTKIETDSYAAVQLIEQKGELNFESLKYMAEQVQGSFSFSILDYIGNLYLVKGDSPLIMLHFIDLGFYIYASTEDILWKAMAGTFLLKHIQSAIEGKNDRVRRVMINNGEIIKIDTKGDITNSTFNFDEISSIGHNWWDYGLKSSKKIVQKEDSYIKDLKSVASHMGYTSDDIDALIDCGYTYEEIEELIYDNDYENGYGDMCYHFCGR